jgi:hypothetical protein
MSCNWASYDTDSALIGRALERGRPWAIGWPRTMDADVEPWGVGLHRSLVSKYRRASAPPTPVPGYAPTGATGLHVATCMRPAPLAEGGAALGHEILIPDLGCSFNSRQSRPGCAG